MLRFWLMGKLYLKLKSELICVYSAHKCVALYMG